MKKLTIGLFGFGVVGEGIFHVLNEHHSLSATIKKICIRDVDKKRNADKDLFTDRADELLNDPDINLIVELIDDPLAAFDIVRTALRKGKMVVSANKAMIAAHLPELIALQEEYQTSFLYEAAVCGSIPVIRNLEEYYDNDLLKSVYGIVNGSTNYILTKMIAEDANFSDALRLAQAAGFAESDPSLDVSGKDAANKLTILLLHAYGCFSTTDSILRQGIDAIDPTDIRYAAEKGYKIKLTAQARKLSDGKLAAFVLPQFVSRQCQLYAVDAEYNGVVIESKLADKQFLYGKGAGRYPTSSAVLSDIAALRYAYKYEYRKRGNGSFELSDDYYLRVYVSFHDWNLVNKWDFEWVEESHSSEERQYLIGVIAKNKLQEADWFISGDVSVIGMPESILESSEILKRAMRKMSLKLAGVL